MADNVNHPKHYESGNFECIDVMIETQGVEKVMSFCLCNAFKYLYRHTRKNGTEDIAKAKWYIDKYIELSEREGVKKMNLTELSKEIHQNAVDHGWWDEPRSFAEIVALCHSELSEALEEDRQGKPIIYIENGKPEGIATEMIDCLIRILDWCACNCVDVDALVQQKHEFNKSRPYKHGKKY